MNIKTITNQVFKQFPELQELDPDTLQMIVEYILHIYEAQEGK
jgi:hypothetical protein